MTTSALTGNNPAPAREPDRPNRIDWVRFAGVGRRIDWVRFAGVRPLSDWVRFAGVRPLSEWVRFGGLIRHVGRLGSFCPGLVLLAALAGCDANAPPRLVVATSWPVEDRAAVESMILKQSGTAQPIEWIGVVPGESLARTIDRRGGVDLLLGASRPELDRLARAGRLDSTGFRDGSSWFSMVRPGSKLGSFGKTTDPRDNPAALAEARAILEADGWPRGYERLVRRFIADRRGQSPVETKPTEPLPRESIAIIKTGRHLDKAHAWVDILVKSGIARREPDDSRAKARTDALLADLLGAALIDASRELRDAGAALVAFNHPARAEGSIGERPPWPPASVLKLRDGPSGEVLVETLLEQVAPDRAARDWLRESWSRPRRPIDGAVLEEIARAVDGRLVYEPRFRAWLRGEWTAWTRQLYRRVARLAGGYVPS